MWSIPAMAQDQGNLQNSTTTQPAAPQPAVPTTANTTTASEAGQPQDAATAPDVSQGNTVQGGTAQSDDIIVTGLRGSLQRNLDLKRTSSGVVDVISAEDIGKFPDSNVAASCGCPASDAVVVFAVVGTAGCGADGCVVVLF